MNQTKKAERKALEERHRDVSRAIQLEMAVVNETIEKGGIAIIDTFCGPYQLDFINSDFWYITHPKGKQRDSFNRRSWAGCNDRTWEDILGQLGIERHPLFKK